MSEPAVVALAYIPLSEALICFQCEVIQVAPRLAEPGILSLEQGVPQTGGSARRGCRCCASDALVPLGKWLGSLKASPPYDAIYPSIEAWAADRRRLG